MNISALKFVEKKQISSEAFSNAFKEHKIYIYFCLYFYLITYIFLNFKIGYSDTKYFTEIFSFFIGADIDKGFIFT